MRLTGLSLYDALKNPLLAYEYTLYKKDISINDKKKLHNIICTNPRFAFRFALNVSWADINICQKAACKSSESAYNFAKDIVGADIIFCQRHIIEPLYMYLFYKYITGSDASIAGKVLIGSLYENYYKLLVMSKACE